MFEYDKFYRECQTENQPFIKARKNPIDNNFVVLVDLMTCNYDLTLNDEKAINQLFTEEINFLKKNIHTKSMFKGCNVDKEMAWFDGILTERLEVFCENLFNLATKSHK